VNNVSNANFAGPAGTAIIDRREKPCRRGQATKGPDGLPHVGDFQVRELLLNLDRVVPSDASLLDDTVAEITAAIDRTGCWEDVETIGLVVREALTNAIIHGNHCQPQKTVRVSVTVNEYCDLLINVKDSGSGFDISRLSEPINGEDVLANHGRGISLMKQFMDQVEFEFDHGTEVRMSRRRQWLE
jgi:anti-sigma regulatory factor (Ser/Thr protein kinase)